MQTLTVSLKMAQSVKDFVNIVSRYPYPVYLKSGRFTIDAKSLLGIFSLNISKPLTMEIHSDDCEKLVKELEKFTVR